ncbi:MAG: hypothetical protein GX575_32565, partial [Candidatus Anammoximicrobium sp.]|nr:hypothetical protein [Candidatus Anammoximicrobium sp.]
MTSRKTMTTVRDKNQTKKSRSRQRGRKLILEQLEDRRLLASYSASLGPTSGAIPVPVFNQSLGWLTGVDLQVTLEGGGTNSSPGHDHGVSYLSYGASTTFASPGGHSHNVTISPYSGNGLTVSGFSFTTGSVSNNGHGIPPYSSATTIGGTAAHTFSDQTNVHSYTGGDLAPFLAGSNFAISTGSTGTTATDGNHVHGDPRTGGTTGSDGAHSHLFSLAWSTTATFTYNLNSAPSANAGGPYLAGITGALTLNAGSSTDVDIPQGDSIVSYEWDLDNNGSYEISTSNATYAVPQAARAALGLGTHTIGLRVTDEFGAASTDSAQLTLDYLAIEPRGPTSGAIPIPVFNQSLGWLTDVDLQLTLEGGGTSSSPPHDHNVNSSSSSGGTVAASPPSHAHSVNVPPFSGGGLSLSGFSFATSSVSNSGHSVPPYWSVTTTGGTSGHVFNDQVRTSSYSGAGLSPFLAASDFNISTGSSVNSSTDGAHYHLVQPFNRYTSTDGAHSHPVSLLWSTQTEFTFVPNSAPTSDAGGPYSTLLGQSVLVNGSASTDIDIPFGDSIVSYEWDTDNNGVFDSPSASPTLNISSATTLALGGGVHTIALRVTDEKGAQHVDTTTLTVTIPTTVSLDGSNNLVLQDNTVGKNDLLTVSLDTTPNPDEIVIHDPNYRLGTSIAGATGSGTNTLRVPISGIAGITVNTLAGNDTLTVNFSGGNPALGAGITFNGGDPTSGAGDKLVVTGGTFATAVYDATAPHNGTLTLGAAVINFTGLEPTDLTGSSLGDYTINVDPSSLVAGTVTTTVAASGGTDTLVSFTSGLENTLIRTITGTLTINGDNVDPDVFNVQGVGSSFAASLTVTGQGGTDEIHLQTGAGLTLGAGESLSLTGETIDQTGPVTVPGTTTLNNQGSGTALNLTNASNNFAMVAVTAGGNVSLTDANGIDLGASTVSGGMIVSAGGAVTDSGDVSVGSNASFSGASITLGGGGETTTFGSLTFTSGGAVAIQEDASTALVGANTAASAVLTSIGAITNAAGASVNVSGTASISGSTVTLGDQVDDSMHFGSLTFSSPGAVDIREDSGTLLTAANSAASLRLTSAGGLAQTAGSGISVTGNANFSGTAITLGANGETDNFGSLTFNSGGNVNIHELSGVLLTGTSTASSLILGAYLGGLLTNDASASLNVALSASLIGNGGIDLGNQAGDSINFGSLNFSGANGAVVISEDSSTRVVGANLAQVGLTLVSSDDVTLDGAVTVIGNTLITAGTTTGGIDVNAKLTGSGTIQLDAADEITIDADIDPTTVDLDADDDITVNAAVSATDAINVRAGNDGSGSVSVTAAGSLTTTNAGSDVLVRAGTASGSISLAGSVTAVDRLTLTSQAGVSQTAATIAAANLQLTGVGTFSLTQSGNDVDAMAASTDGQIAYADTDDLEVGTVATTGIATTDDDVRLCAASLSLSESISAGTGTVRLTASTGGITQTGGIVTAAALGLAAPSGSISLPNANDVDTLAAVVGGTFSFADSDGFAIGTVPLDGCFPGATGITGATDVELCAGSGGMSITTPLTATGTVRLSAGGGDITQSATGVVTAANLGARATGNVDLNTLVNVVSGTFAAASTTAGVVEFQNSGGFTVGTVTAGACFAATVGATTADGNIDLDANAGGLTIDDVVTAGLAGTVALNADAGTVDINAVVSSTSGAIDVTGDAVTQDADITTGGAGTVDVTADNGPITMADGTTTSSDIGTIAYDATGDVALSLLTSTGGAINVTAGAGPSLVGAITDNTAGEGANLVTAGMATLDAETGIGSGGSAADIETSIATLDAYNGTSGDIVIFEVAGPLASVGENLKVNRAIQDGTAGSISLTVENGNLTVLAGAATLGVRLANGGNTTGTITLDANLDATHVNEESPGTRGDVTLNNLVTSQGGSISITADHDVLGAAAGDVTSNGGAIGIMADANGSSVGGNGDGTIQVDGMFDAGTVVTSVVTLSLPDCDGYLGSGLNLATGQGTNADGSIVSASQVIKNGAGALRLNGTANAYLGTTAVNAGALIVNGVITTDGGAITVGTGALLGGNGTIGATPGERDIQVSAGGILDPGDLDPSNCMIAYPGQLAVNGDIAFHVDGIFRVQLNGLAAGVDSGTYTSDGYDQLVLHEGVPGTLDLGGFDFGIGGAGARLQADAGYVMPVGAEHTIVVYDPGDLIDQRFRDPNNSLATLDEGEFFYSGGTGNLMNISYYTKSDDNDVTLTHPGRYDFNGFGNHTATEQYYEPLSPFQEKTINTAGWVGTLPWYFERFSASDPGWDRLRYDGQSTDPMGNPLTFA